MEDHGIAPEILCLLADSAAALACVAAGWLARALIEEAVASARLDGDVADATDLTLLDADAIDRVPDPALGQAAVILAMLRQAASRSPRQLFTPRRLAAAVRLRQAGDRSVPVDLPRWLQDRLPAPGAALAALGRALDPAAVASWTRLPALLGAAALVAHWQASGAAHDVGAAAGRALAAMWPARAGISCGMRLMPATGFLGHAAALLA